MFKEILQVIPKLDSSALNKMTQTLGSRFAKISKGFGKGLLGAIKGGGILGLATAAIDKLLNPLKETQDAIERTLTQADDVVTNAEQFGSTPGELFKLQKLAQAQGLDASGLDQLILKFQGAVAEASADPTKKTAVREFAKDTNTVQSFYQFIQALNKMDRNQQLLVQQEIFGEKQTLKMADFLRADFQKLNLQLGTKDAAAYTPGLEKLGALADLNDALKAKREIEDTMKKSTIINSGMVTSRDAAEKLDLQKENQAIANYKNLQSISDTTTKMMTLLQEATFKLGEFITFATPAVNKALNYVETIAKSPFMRGIGSSISSMFGGKGK